MTVVADMMEIHYQFVNINMKNLLEQMTGLFKSCGYSAKQVSCTYILIQEKLFCRKMVIPLCTLSQKKGTNRVLY